MSDLSVSSPAESSSSESAMVELIDVEFRRGERTLFSGLSLSIPQGKICAIMGPSGTGKTTLLRLIGGELKPDAGQVRVAGVDVHSLSRGELFELRKSMGLLFQSSALFADLSVFENVAFPLREHTNLPEDTIRDLVLMKLNAVGLRNARDLMPAQLSGGMARRVALARAIALDPQLIMYDEPFTGQDPIALGTLLRLIQQSNAALQSTTLLVSHDVHETRSIADLIFVLADGRVIGAGPPETLDDSPSPMLRQFMRGEPDGPVPFHYPGRSLADDLG
ncbi:MAG: ABC transporter ATP-binding protein [Pseudomonadota bacterium]